MDILINGEPQRVPAAATIADVLRQLDLQSKYVAVERNRELVPRRQHDDCRLKPGDELEIVTLVGGG